MSERPKAEDILAAEQAVQFPWFDSSTAWQVGSWIQAEAALRQLPIAIEVTRAGQLLFFCSMPGANPDNAHWVRKKRMVVDRFHKSSLYMRTMLDAAGRTIEERYGLPHGEYAASGGAVPILLRHSGCIGAVAVSGLTQYDDHDLALAALRAVLAAQEQKV